MVHGYSLDFHATVENAQLAGVLHAAEALHHVVEELELCRISKRVRRRDVSHRRRIVAEVIRAVGFGAGGEVKRLAHVGQRIHALEPRHAVVAHAGNVENVALHVLARNGAFAVKKD